MWLLLPLLAASSSCPSFQCGKLQNDLCIQAGNPILFQPCSDSPFTYCPYTDFSTSSQCIPLSPSPIGTAYPGDPCSSNLTCLYSNCENGICQGLVPSSPCADTGQCTPGHRCEYNKCKVLLPLGPSDGSGLDANCTVDSDCVNNGVCDSGNCFEYFSKDQTDPVGNCENGVSLVCKSGLCYNGYCLSEEMKSFKTKNKGCLNDDDCVSTFYNTKPHFLNFSSGCKCGMSPDGLKFCGLFPGDDLMKKYIKLFKEWINSSECKKCHSYSRNNFNCIKEYWDKNKAETLAYYMFQVNNWRNLQDIEDCVEKIVYFNYNKGSDDESSKAAWMTLSMLIFLLW